MFFLLTFTRSSPKLTYIELVLHELGVEFYTNLLSNANKQCY